MVIIAWVYVIQTESQLRYARKVYDKWGAKPCHGFNG